jgi:hypothetical protein
MSSPENPAPPNSPPPTPAGPAAQRCVPVFCSTQMMRRTAAAILTTFAGSSGMTNYLLKSFKTINRTGGAKLRIPTSCQPIGYLPIWTTQVMRRTVATSSTTFRDSSGMTKYFRKQLKTIYRTGRTRLRKMAEVSAYGRVKTIVHLHLLCFTPNYNGQHDMPSTAGKTL